MSLGVRNLKINDDETKKAIAKIKRLPKVLENLSRVAVEMIGKEAVMLAKINHPYEDHTGKLTRSITSTPGRVGIKGPYVYISAARPGKWVEKGTKAHIIFPKEKKFLRFPAWAKGGRSGASGVRFVFAKKVYHPGSFPYPFLLPAIMSTVRGARAVQIWRQECSALRVAQGLRNLNV